MVYVTLLFFCTFCPHNGFKPQWQLCLHSGGFLICFAIFHTLRNVKCLQWVRACLWDLARPAFWKWIMLFIHIHSLGKNTISNMQETLSSRYTVMNDIILNVEVNVWHFLYRAFFPGYSRIWRGKSLHVILHLTKCKLLHLIRLLFCPLLVSTGTSVFVWKRRERPSRKSSEFFRNKQNIVITNRFHLFLLHLTKTNSRVEKETQASEGHLVLEEQK